MEFVFDRDIHKISHNLNPIFRELERYKTCAALEASTIFRENKAELERIRNGMEWQNTVHNPPPASNIRVVSWNVERGINLDGIINALQTHPVLSKADILLLTEVDIGMGRSGNHNIPEMIANAVNMNYCFANSFLVLAKGDEGEQLHDQENTLSLHGTAILSRYKMQSCQTTIFPAVNDCFATLEKQLGNRRGLICKIKIGEAEYEFAAGHLDLRTTPRERAIQLETILKALNSSPSAGQVIGGDFNTHTYQLSSKFHLFCSFLYKLLFVGVNDSIAHYMNPQLFYEKPLFDAIRKYGFDFEQYNDLTAGTLVYDLYEPTLNLKTRKYLPGRLFSFIEKILVPWNGRVPMRLDWMAGRGFKSARKPNDRLIVPRVIELPFYKGTRVSDHFPIVADISY